jgi:hypothetical protein
MTTFAFFNGIAVAVVGRLVFDLAYPLVRRVLDRLDDRFRLRDICRDCTIRRVG